MPENDEPEKEQARRQAEYDAQKLAQLAQRLGQAEAPQKAAAEIPQDARLAVVPQRETLKAWGIAQASTEAPQQAVSVNTARSRPESAASVSLNEETAKSMTNGRGVYGAAAQPDNQISAMSGAQKAQLDKDVAQPASRLDKAIEQARNLGHDGPSSPAPSIDR